MGGIRLITLQVKQLVEDKNGIFLGERTEKNRRYINIKCVECGNVWEILLTNLKDGDWCKVCYKNKKCVNRKKVLALVDAKGYELRTDGELGLKTPFKVYCHIHDVEWDSCYWNFKYNGEGGGSCKYCISGAASKKEIEEFLDTKNGTFIKRIKGTINDPRNLIVRCNIHNKEFKTSWSALQDEIWCAKCDDDNRTISYDQIKQLVESKNGQLLTTDCYSATMLFDVRCKANGCDRVWPTTYARINQGCWCPKCAGFDRYTLDEVKQLIGDRGILLTTEILNAQQKIDIKCKCDCSFSIHIYNLARGGWCSACYGTTLKAQTELFNIVKDLFTDHEVLYNQYPFIWLRDKNKLEIDIWIPSLKLAIEYDGKQHFVPTKFSKSMTDKQVIQSFQIIQYHDELKNTLISQHTQECSLIRFKYNEPLNKEYVSSKLQQAGFLISNTTSE